jgi:hypothetical protein
MRSALFAAATAITAITALTVVAGCGAADLATPAECNPLGGLACVTPWPSAIYERADAASPSGVRLDLAAGSLPVNREKIPIDAARFNGRTGFSPASQIFTAFPVAVDGSPLVSWKDIAASLTDASPTVLVDMSTGARVAHWAELDANTDATMFPEDQALYIRPAVRLKGGTRYAVAIRTTLKAVGGGALPVPEGFAAIRDGSATTHARLEAVRPRYAEIFAALAQVGVARGDLVVAWDFVTATDDDVTGDMLAARDAALAAMGPLGANLTVHVTANDAPDPDDARIARRIQFDYGTPDLLAGDGRQGLNRGPDGKPVVMGTLTAHGAALIPPCATAATKVPILIFGHGFFGGLAEGQGEYLRRVSRDLCVVVLSGEWRGMTTPDLAFAAKALNDANNIPFFGQLIVQGIVDFIALEQLARGALAANVLVDGTGASVVDPTKIYFLGISQGHILGSTFAAYDPFITRAALFNGGGDWGMLFERSTKWLTFRTILGGAYDGNLTLVLMQQLLQFGLDYTDPIEVAPRVLANPLPGSPAKQLLHIMGKGDSAVPNLASELQARTIGLPLLGPAVAPVYGLTETPGPLPSALVVWDEHPTPLPPDTNLLNGDDNTTHDTLRKRDAVVALMKHFFETGEVANTCAGGPCDCATGACGAIGE